MLPFPMPDAGKVKLKYKKKWVEYYKLYCGFDIETSAVTIPRKKKSEPDKHLSFMYHWQLSIIGDDWGHVFMGRYWGEFMDLMERLEKHYNLSSEKRLLIWIANAGYEFSYIQHKFEWDPGDFFAKELRHPLKFRSRGFEFHEILSISGGSLAQLAKDFTTTQKLKGDLDYTIFRSGRTPLTTQEKAYCINDVTILSEMSKFLFTNFIEKDKRIPLTKTGILRSECRQECIKLLGVEGFKKYLRLIRECYPDAKTYKLWFKWLFRGGYVHANILLAGLLLLGVLGDDRCSSYPAEMLTKLKHFPNTPFKPLLTGSEDLLKRIELLESVINEKCCIIDITLTNVRRKTSLSLESRSKCIELEGSAITPIVIDNGRVAQCAKMRVLLTEIDYKLYTRYYDFTISEIHSIETSERGPLPIFIRRVLAKYYVLKDKLKKSGKKDTPEYSIIKAKVNSFFGMLCTRLSLDKVVYNNGWDIQEAELDYDEEVKNQFLLPQHGIWVTALARAELLNPTMDITQAIGYGNGDDGAGVIYNDTDSIKYYDPKGKAKKIFERYNKEMEKRRKAAGLTAPEFSTLGNYEPDGETGYFEKFKTLGAKRYLSTENGVTHATIAGLPKAAILNIEGDPYEAFNADGMLIDAELSLKSGITYNDEPTTYTAPDGEIMHEDSSAAIFSLKFTMNLDKLYYSMIANHAEEGLRKYGD